MLGIDATLKTSALDGLIAKLEGALAVAVQECAPIVYDLVKEQIHLLGAEDTLALSESTYMSVYGASTYEEAVAAAFWAYVNNPTNWPELRARFGDELEFNPQVVSESPYDAWVACAAAHDVENEYGFLSAYGNWVEPRPFIHNAAREMVPLVNARLSAAIREAMRG